MTEDAGSRWIALIGAASLHIAVGLALLSAATSGVPTRGVADSERGNPIVVNIVPFESPGDTQSKAEAAGAAEGRKDADQSRPDASRGATTLAVVDQRNGAAEVESGPSLTAPMVGSSSADLPSAEVLAYRAKLQAHLARYRVYPAEARRERRQGAVVLRLQMNQQGQVIDVWVEVSSGVAAIDAEAVAAASRAEPLPAFPAGWPERMSIAVPVLFRLD